MAKTTKVGAKELAMRQQFQAENICGGQKKNGGICMNAAGMGTDHVGTGACHLHDHYHAIVRQTGVRYKDGLAPTALEFYLRMANDPEIKSLDSEIAILRTSLNDCNLMIQEIRERSIVMEPDGAGGLQQNSSKRAMLPQAFGEKFDPAGTADHKAILALNRDRSRIAESIAKLVERKAKMEEGKLVTYRQVQEVLGQVIYVIKKNCEGCKNLTRVAEDFATIDVSKFEPK